MGPLAAGERHRRLVPGVLRGAGRPVPEAGDRGGGPEAAGCAVALRRHRPGSRRRGPVAGGLRAAAGRSLTAGEEAGIRIPRRPDGAAEESRAGACSLSGWVRRRRRHRGFSWSPPPGTSHRRMRYKGRGAGRAGDRTGQELSCAVERQLRPTFPPDQLRAFQDRGTAGDRPVKGVAGRMSAELEARDGERFPAGCWWVERGPHKNRLPPISSRRVLLAIKSSRSKRSAGRHPIQRSRGLHLKAPVCQPASPTHMPFHSATQAGRGRRSP